jgi:hypothetical protein
MHMKKFINLLSIELLHPTDAEHRTIKKTIQSIKNRTDKKTLLTVDKINDANNEYCLIDGYNEYEALYEMEADQMVLCNVISYRNRKEQLYRVLKEVLQTTATNMRVKHYLTWELVCLGESEASMMDELNCTKEELDFMLVDPMIPLHYMEKTILLQKTELMNAICKTRKFSDEMKQSLYEWAVSPKKDDKTLTIEKLENIESIFSNVDSEHVDKQMLESFLQAYVKNPSPILLDLWEQDRYKEFYIP